VFQTSGGTLIASTAKQLKNQKQKQKQKQKAPQNYPV
jgi:hypothetical protein